MTSNRQTSQIDKVFNHLAKGLNDQIQRPRKRRRVEPESYAQGGFIIDDAPGGFIPEDTEPATSEPESDPVDQSNRIPLNLIPDALQLLDLPPDDPEILAVFRNAASGWSNQLSGNSDDRSVTRADFRSVCLVLLGAEDAQEDTQVAELPDASEESDEDASDVYKEPSLSPPSVSEMEYDDEDFTPDSGLRSGAKRRKRRKPSHAEEHDFSSSRPLTARQKEVCSTAFQLFFPSVKAEELSHRRIFMKDLIRVADSIKERLKSDDMLEMLAEFSSSSDKSMGLEDFERMMVAAKLA